MPKTVEKNKKFQDLNYLFYGGFSTKKQTFFAKRLSFLIQAGVPVLESLHLIRKQAKSKSEGKIMERVIADLANGQTLATSLERWKKVFSPFTVNVIRAGETSGTLTANLNYLASELKKKESLRRKILSALLYPIIVTIATFGITALLIVYIFPKILPVFQSLDATLPLSTRIVIFLSETIRDYGLWILLGIALLWIGLGLLVKYLPRARFIRDGLILQVPFFGAITKNYNLANVTRTMGLLLRSGLPLSEALAVTADTTENTRYKNALTEVSEGAIKGKAIAELMAQAPGVFPDMTVHMLSVGERSGNLSNTLIYLSEYYENEFDELTKNLSSSIEPVLMIIMGLIVGFVAISVITPIYEITNTLQR